MTTSTTNAQDIRRSSRWVTCPPRVARTRKRATLAAIVLAAGLAAACGGGDGNNGGGVTPPPPPPPPPPPATTTLTGTAAKGLLANAIVTVTDVAANGAAGTSVLATSRTDARGQFTASVPGSGPIVVTVTTDAQSTMLDELDGVARPAPAGLVLRAALAGPTTTPFAVTPLTEMAFGIASAAAGGLTIANIDAANSAVSAAMLGGAPVLSTLPIDLADYRNAAVAQQAQAKLLTALAVSAREGIATGASGVPCADADYGSRLVCAVAGLRTLLIPGASNAVTFASQAAYLVTAYEMINGGLVTVAGGQRTSALGLDGVTAAERALSEAVSTQAVLFGYVASATPLQNTKALFADLRTNVIQFREGVDVFGVTPLAAELREDISTNVAPVLRGTQAVLVGVYTAAGLIDAAVAGSIEEGSGHFDVVCGYDPVVLQHAGNAAVCRYGSDYDEQILLTVTRSAPDTYSVTSQPLDYSEGGDPTAWDGIFNVGYGQYARDPTLSPLAATLTWSIQGAAQSVAWTGPYYVTVDGGRVTASLSAAQSADWNPLTQSGTLSVSGRLSDGAGGVALQEAVIGTDSQIVLQNAAVQEGIPSSVSGAFSLSRLATGEFEYAARATIAEPVLDKSATLGLPQGVALTGAVARLGTGGGPATPIFNGRIELALQGISGFDATLPLSDENSLVAQLQVAGNLALPDSRVLTVSVTANATRRDPTPAAPHSLSATYAYTTPAGMARINVSGTYDETNGYQATVTTNAGVAAAITRTVGGALTGTVTANGVATATIDGTTINYSDGSTESVF